ncbi:MAG: EamA family transporter [Lachnospiraceae bacterium]|nr:EamA family transporter [Lachnospiraceae bacterium]
MLYGVAAIVCASALFSVMPTVQKYALLSGLPAGSMVFCQELCMFLWASLRAWRELKDSGIGYRAAAKLTGFGAVGIGLTNVFYGHALELLPIGTVVLLHFLYPVMVLLIMAALFKKKVTAAGYAAAAISVAGLVLVSGTSSPGNLFGMGLALASGLCYAAFVVSNDTSSGTECGLPVRLFFMTLGALLVSFVILPASGGFAFPSGIRITAVLLFGLGLGSCLAFYLMSKGVGLIGAGRAAFFNMLEPVGALFVGAAVYQETLTGKKLAGCVLVLAGAMVLLLDRSSGQGRENKKSV